MLVEIMKGNYTGRELVFIILVVTLALTLSFSFHEFMHAAVASWLGDYTPKYQGRVTLNPVAHLDPFGTICIILLGFGWGKPVQYNPNNLRRFKSKRLMNIMVHLAGVTGNFILALIASIIMTIVAGVTGVDFMMSRNGVTFIYVFYYIREFSLGLLAFNLLPFPPLDGFHVVEELLPYKAKYSDGWKNFIYYGRNVLLILIIVGSFTEVRVLSLIMDFIKLPFELLISVICMFIGGLF